ncbi:MAG: MarR family transcriptional regulator [Phycisphaerae bacterium]
MNRDAVDLFVDQWNSERPDLDPSPLGVVSRVLMLEKLLEQSADRALARFGLSLWQFDVLAALRRSGPPFKLSPTHLMQLVTLTSGAMTNRIDRLEALKLVMRESDPDDRRGVLIALTPEGRKLVDEAIAGRLDAARRDIAELSSDEAATLAALLRKVLIAHAGPITTQRRNRRRQETVAAGGADA